jgi:DNA-binding response OmpR family regulator
MNQQRLLVEDDDAIAQALRLHLEEAGFRLHREADGRQRWDLVLPSADGWAVCRHLRERHAGVPVVMLSARSAEAHRVLGLELGADDYLAWPFSMPELVARILALFRRIEQLSAAIPPVHALRFGPFLLDAVRRELLRGEQVVPLTLRRRSARAAAGGHRVGRGLPLRTGARGMKRQGFHSPRD